MATFPDAACCAEDGDGRAVSAVSEAKSRDSEAPASDDVTVAAEDAGTRRVRVLSHQLAVVSVSSTR